MAVRIRFVAALFLIGVLLCGAVSRPALAQNAQCTLLTGSSFGQAVPIDMNPAPPANAACKVGNDTGYVSRTSSGVGVHSNSVCTITAQGHTLEIPYEGHPVPAAGELCKIGNVTGTITQSSARSNANAQCTLLTGANFGKAVPYTANPAPRLNAPCKIGNDTGYVSRTSVSGANPNAQCTITANSKILAIPYAGNPAPVIDAPCQIGNLGGYISKTTNPSNAVNAQCTVVVPSFTQSAPYPGNSVAYYGNPTPRLDSPCTVGSMKGFISATTFPNTHPNAVCVITTATNITINAPYEAHPPPQVNSTCVVAGFIGHIAHNNVAWSPGSKPFDLVWETNSDGSLDPSGVDANGYPLNPMWYPQVKDPTDPKNNPDFPSTCGLTAFANQFPCSTQNPFMDLYQNSFLESFGVCRQSDTIIPGHLNFYVATYTGNLYFDDWSDGECKLENLSACGADHDYNLALVRPDYSGMTSVNDDEDITYGRSSDKALHVEFNSDESIDSWFGSPWWKGVRHNIETTPYGGFLPAAMFGGRAVVTGVLGIDGVHRGGYTEIHPVFSLAVEDPPTTRVVGKDLYLDETWHFFIRNRGTEGTCSSHVYTWSPFRGGNPPDYYIQLPWAAAGDTRAASVKSTGGLWYSGVQNPLTPDIELEPGSWTLLHFRMPVSTFGEWSFAGYDGDVSLEYKFPGGAGLQPQMRKLAQSATKPVKLTLHPFEREADWDQLMAHVADPNAKTRLQSFLLAHPLVASRPKLHPVTVRPTMGSLTVKRTRAVQPSLLRPQAAADPVVAAYFSGLKAATNGLRPITAPAAANFAGTWTATTPADPALPSTLTLSQSGNYVVFGALRLTVNQSTASRTLSQTCAPQLQKPGYNYGPNNVAATRTLRMTLQGSVLTYETETTWKAPCGGHSIGTERAVSRYRR